MSPFDYPDNMSMVILLTAEGQPVTDAEVAAFVNGECRGAAFADYDDESGLKPLYYLLIAGEDSGQPMEIRVALGNANERYEKVVCDTLIYTSDGNIGTPWEPFVIDIGDQSGIATVVSDRVPGIWYTLQGIRVGTTKPTSPGVYLHNGRIVVIK